MAGVAAWGLALSGGALLGAAHLGVVAALEEWGLRPTVLTGSSAGGLVAGALAAGAPLAGLLDLGAAVDRAPLQFFRPRLLRLLGELLPADPLPPVDALLDPAPFLARLLALCPPPRRIEAWRQPAAVTAVDLARLEAVAFVRPASGAAPVPPPARWRVRVASSLAVALQATMAMPGVLAPVRTSDEFLVDGGVADNLPADWAAALGARCVLAVDVAAAQRSLPPRAGILWTLSRVENYMTHTLSALRRPGVPVLTLRPDTGGIRGLGIGEFARLVDLGRQAAEALRGPITEFVTSGRGTST